MKKSAPVLAFVQNETALDAIRQAAGKQSLQVEAYATVDDLPLPSKAQSIQGQNEPGEPLHGQTGILFSAFVEKQPAAIIFDLDNPLLDWKTWAANLKSSPATRRIPILTYSEAVDADVRRQSKNYGIDLVTRTEKFLIDLPKILQKYVKIVDPEAMAAACAEPLSDLAIKGLELFNQGEFYDCHEELEHAWNDDSGPAKELYRAVLQVAVAYLQIERGNYNGAVKMFMRVKQWLEPLPDVCRTINIAQLQKDADAVYAELLNVGKEGIEDFDRSLFKPAQYG